MTTPRFRVTEVMEGLLLPLEATRLLLSRPSWLALAALPALASLVALVAAAATYWSRGETLFGRLWGRPADGLLAIVWTAAFVGVGLVVTFVAGFVSSRVLMAPALDALAARVVREGLPASEREGAFAERPWTRTLVPSIVRALGSAATYVGGVALLWLMALLPVVGLAFGPLALAWTVAWLLADSLSYPLAWVGEGRLSEAVEVGRASPGRALGLAMTLGLFGLVPLSTVVLTPVAVVAAALLVLKARGLDFRGRERADLDSAA
jgi:uncharacterized protein involved in cysteine biosynthesis